MMAKKRNNIGKIVNRRARFDYDLSDSLIVGIVLNGRETRALRTNHGHLRGAYITVKDGELWLINATISDGETFKIEKNEQTRSRKLLAHKNEINKLIAAKQQGMTIVPTEFITTGHRIKLKIAVGRGKKRYDKRHAIKQRDLSREIANNLKH